MITLKQMRHALAVAEQASFRKAAESCALSQSALSSSITEMERLLGFKVFERDNRRVLVTGMGKVMLAKARGIVTDAADLVSLVDHVRTPLSGPMSIGVIPTIAPYLLPVILPTLEDSHPNLQLTIDEDQSRPLVDRVLAGQLDTAIVALPYDCSGLLTFPFWDEDFYYVVHRDDADVVGGYIDLERIELSRLMLLNEGHCLKDHALAVCGLSSEERVSTRGTSLSTLIQLVMGRFGSTLVPEIALPHLVANNPDLSFARLNEEGPHRSLAFAVRTNYPGLHNIEHLKVLLRERLLDMRQCLVDGSEKTNTMFEIN